MCTVMKSVLLLTFADIVIRFRSIQVSDKGSTWLSCLLLITRYRDSLVNLIEESYIFEIKSNYSGIAIIPSASESKKILPKFELSRRRIIAESGISVTT